MGHCLDIMFNLCLAELGHKNALLWFLGESKNLFLPTAHQNRVSAITFCLTSEWVISTGHDKCISWMCTRSGTMLGRHYFTSWASCLQYPLKTECYRETGRILGYFSSIYSLLFLEKARARSLSSLKTLILIRCLIPLFLLAVVRW